MVKSVCVNSFSCRVLVLHWVTGKIMYVVEKVICIISIKLWILFILLDVWKCEIECVQFFNIPRNCIAIKSTEFCSKVNDKQHWMCKKMFYAWERGGCINGFQKSNIKFNENLSTFEFWTFHTIHCCTTYCI